MWFVSHILIRESYSPLGPEEGRGGEGRGGRDVFTAGSLCVSLDGRALAVEGVVHCPLELHAWHGEFVAWAGGAFETALEGGAEGRRADLLR